MFTNPHKLVVILTLAGFMLPALSMAQDSVPPQRHDIPPHLPGLPQVPQFPGGKDSLNAFIKRNLRYPAPARKHNIKGTIEVDFWVDEEGKLSKIHVYKPLGYGCDKEAVRVVKKMPQWVPGMNGRKPMAMDYHVDITFGKPETK